MRIKPFAAIRPVADKVAQVAAVPYDVVDTREAKALAEGNPYSFLRVTRPEIDLPPETDIHSQEVYKQAALAFEQLRDQNILIQEESESLYLYRQIMGDHTQIGLVACCHIDDYATSIIRKHEKTRKDKEDDRTNHCMALMANSGPVFLTYRDSPAITALTNQVITTIPLYDFTADDNIQHTVWRISENTSEWVELFAAIPLAYVADGHHRSAAAFRTGQELRSQDSEPNNNKEYNWFLTVLFPATSLCIMPYNRCVADLNQMDASTFLQKVENIFKTVAAEDGVPTQPREVRMYLDGKWYSLQWEPFAADPARSLDVSVLQERLLTPLLNIGDPRTDNRISFIGGIRGVSELEKLVDSGKNSVAFSMFPVTVDQMMDIADAEQIMPPKSTWFEPKLRSGLLIHTLAC